MGILNSHREFHLCSDVNRLWDAAVREASQLNKARADEVKALIVAENEALNKASILLSQQIRSG